MGLLYPYLYCLENVCGLDLSLALKSLFVKSDKANSIYRGISITNIFYPMGHSYPIISNT